MSDFVHLHVHSHYSLLDGLGKVEEYVEKAKKHGMKAVALTDKGNVHGLIDLYKACEKAGIKAILGCEAYVASRSRFDKEAGVDTRRNHIVLLAKNRSGYENLLQLSTEAFLTGMYYKPRIDLALLKEHASGLIAILPQMNGEVGRYLLNGEEAKAEESLRRYEEIFGNDLYLEILHRPHLENGPELRQGLLDLSRKSGVPLVATNDVYYVEREDADAHDTLLCLQYTTLKNDPQRFNVLQSDLSFAEEQEMTEWFSDLPEAVSNSAKIAAECDVKFEFGINRIPSFPLPEGHVSEKDYLRHLCLEGVRERYGFDPETKQNIRKDGHSEEKKGEILERLFFELEVIGKMGFDGYFLIVSDFMRWAREQGIAVGPGRGSAAGAIVAYLLRITNLDPLAYNLLFERFLNPERISMPDIDLDFADDRRDEVLEYVRQKYGSDHMAQICTFGTMAARAAVKDVGRVMGLPFTEMNEFGKLIPDRPGTMLEEAERRSPELKKKLEEDEVARRVYDAAKKLEGNVRHISVHACAVVITPEPLLKYTALQHPPKDDVTVITQYSAKPLESLGLLKMDFLGLRNLTILERARKIIGKTTGKTIDLDHLPMDDPKTYELLSKALTTGVFQLEGPGMRRYLKDLKPSNFEDIIAMVSLYRPGPMNFIPAYIERKHGKKLVTYLHKNLEKILRPTFGIAIYQEQILEMARVFAGFTLGEADILRRAIGKKIASELAAQREKFITGAQKQGYEEQLAIRIFDEVIEPFANYGFNRSHAACYALIAYQTAYLKAHYPTEFFAALLSCDMENTDRVIIDISEARHFGIEVLPPDINESFADFTVTREGVIRFGLTAIKGIGQSVVETILTARRNERFATFADFLARMPAKVLNKKSLEALAKAGALSEFLPPRAVLTNLDLILDFVRRETVTHHEEQDSLFGGEDIEKGELELPDMTPARLSERLRWEKEVLGIYVSGHPLQGMKAYFSAKGTPIAAIPDRMRFEKKEVIIHGLCTGIRKLITKKNEVMAIVSLEDLSGKIEAVLFPKIYSGFQPFLKEDAFMKIKGKAEKRNGEWQLVVESLTSWELEQARQEAEQEGLLNLLEKVDVLEGEALEESVPREGVLSENTEEVNAMEEAKREEIEEEKMEELQTEIDGAPVNVVQDRLGVPLERPTALQRFCIDLPDNFSREHMRRLNDLLSKNPGGEEVEIRFHGHMLLFPARVAVSRELEAAIAELLAG